MTRRRQTISVPGVALLVALLVWLCPGLIARHPAAMPELCNNLPSSDCHHNQSGLCGMSNSTPASCDHQLRHEEVCGWTYSVVACRILVICSFWYQGCGPSLGVKEKDLSRFWWLKLFSGNFYCLPTNAVFGASYFYFWWFWYSICRLILPFILIPSPVNSVSSACCFYWTYYTCSCLSWLGCCDIFHR